MTYNDVPSGSAPSCGKSCACHTHLINRRDFLTLAGATTLAAILSPMPVMAGPFESSDFASLIPPDKKLNTEWVRSLYARGVPTVYTKKRDELRYIGMPVGGICCGTVYLGGDGRIWVWDIFNQPHQGVMPGDTDAANGANYVTPHTERSPFEQGFALKTGGVIKRFESSAWSDITFEGQYPLGRVRYSDPDCPVAVSLTAYSPFIPLNADESGVPLTLCEYTLENTTAHAVDVEIGGWLQNAVRMVSLPPAPGVPAVQPGSAVLHGRVSTARKIGRATAVVSTFETVAPAGPKRPDLVVDDFQHETYGDWTVEGTAFGTGPIHRKDVPAYQGDLGGEGERVVNTHGGAPGNTVEERDSRTGTLTSPEFVIERSFLSFYIGGGANIENDGLALLVDGKVVRRAGGQDNNHMRRAVLPIQEFEGRRAKIQIYDRGTGGWGNVGIGAIVQTDHPEALPGSEAAGDEGSMAIAVLGGGIARPATSPDTLFEDAAAPTGPLIGGVTKALRLQPHKPQTVVFAVAWHFPNAQKVTPDAASGHRYAKQFADAGAVLAYAVKEYDRLSKATKLWADTWYDSTLPYWFLDRTFANTSILATTTAHRFATGRFWGWEGTGCCEGTCTHVYHYAQAIGRIFPEIERGHREHVDFGSAFDPATGMIGYRGEGTGPAVDGQCGRILGVYREHQMSADGEFLKRVWPNVKKAMDWVSRHDTDGDGLLEGAQENTLDAAWFGKIPWISSLYAASLKACAAMAGELGEKEYATQCRRKAAQTGAAIETKLFNDEYFIQLPEAGHEHSLGVYQTSHIDQVHGQSWAWQLGLGRVLDQGKTLSALRALYKYNFAPDVGPFKKKNTAGRPYALAGDGGLIMATNPKELPAAFGDTGWQSMYFNECMSGFEHQAASHMIAEGMLLEGLAVTRAIHDRYHATKRNPYNEIECSDHYSRAMASYGSFITMCGFEYHGPSGVLGFAPRLTPENFRAPFVTAEGWGTYTQRTTDKAFHAGVAVKHGALRLSVLKFPAEAVADFGKTIVKRNDKSVSASLSERDGRRHVTFATPVRLAAGDRLEVVFAS